MLRCNEPGTVRMGRMTVKVLRLAIMVAMTAATSPAQTTAASVLSAAEKAAIERQIATLHSPAERKMAEEWSDAKKAAESLCRPAALAAMKSHLPGTDRVLLGTEDPTTLNLASDARLTGTGSARTPDGWQDFTFTCELNPRTGKATGFEPVITGATPPAK
jgi:hypothetical protein